MKLIGEIHNRAEYSGSSLQNVNIDDLLKSYQKNCSMVNIVTEPSLGGNIELLNTVKSKINLPISLLHFHITKEVIQETSKIKNPYLIVIYEYNKNNLQGIVNECIINGITPILEIENIEQAKKVLLIDRLEYIGINTRSLKDLKNIDFKKVPLIIDFIRKNKPSLKIIGESGLENNHQRIGIYSDFWIVGSSILKSRNTTQSIEYFKNNQTNLPYIWLRPSAFCDDKYLKIKSRLKEEGFNIKHTIESDDFLSRYFSLKKDLFYENLKIGKIFLSAVKEGNEYLKNELSVDNGYNEIWFLQNDYLSLEESYSRLLTIKEEFRLIENNTVKSINIGGDSIDVKNHSLHTPDFKDHYIDINNILDIDNNRSKVFKEINDIITN